MEIIIKSAVTLLVGVGLGFIFFWGLWKTINRASTVNHPYLWMISSFIIRTAIVMMGFYLVLLIQWQYMAVTLVGFLVARIFVTRYTAKKSHPINKGMEDGI